MINNEEERDGLARGRVRHRRPDHHGLVLPPMNGPVVYVVGPLPRRLVVIDWAAFILVAVSVAWRLVWEIPPNWGTVVAAVVGACAACELLRHYAVKAVTRDESRIPPRPDH